MRVQPQAVALAYLEVNRALVGLNSFGSNIEVHSPVPKPLGKEKEWVSVTWTQFVTHVENKVCKGNLKGDRL